MKPPLIHMVHDIDPARELSRRERVLIARLLQAPFAGNTELMAQLDHARVSAECAPGCPTIKLTIGSPIPTWPGAHRYAVPVSASTLDRDGVPIEIILHVRDGYIAELEIYRVDQAAIERFPEADAIDVTP